MNKKKSKTQPSLAAPTAPSYMTPKVIKRIAQITRWALREWEQHHLDPDEPAEDIKREREAIVAAIEFNERLHAALDAKGDYLARVLYEALEDTYIEDCADTDCVNVLRAALDQVHGDLVMELAGECPRCHIDHAEQHLAKSAEELARWEREQAHNDGTH